MKRILAIETAVEICSVCIYEEGKIVSLRENSSYNSHASLLAVFIDEVMHESGTAFSELAAVAVSGGPGSYTGLRIGVSAAKGICYAADIPLITVSTLQSMAFLMKKTGKFPFSENYILQPMIDARRMEVFTARFDFRLNLTTEIRADKIDHLYFHDISDNQIIICGGNGSDKIKNLFMQKSNIIFLNDNIHSSTAVAAIGEIKLLNNDFADTVYFEPFYLKEFIPGKPKVKGLQ